MSLPWQEIFDDSSSDEEFDEDGEISVLFLLEMQANMKMKHGCSFLGRRTISKTLLVLEIYSMLELY
jgi:hypothetical protein